MEIMRKEPIFIDERGKVTDIIEGTNIDSITILTTKEGAVRGNHYHEKTTQYAYVLEGKFKLFTKKDGEEVIAKIIEQGDLVLTPPNESHTFLALEDSVLLAFCHGPRAGTHYEDDTYRLETPISQ